MGKINILPPEVYNRIAAGEVVEGPFSVVKELVENSIDSGAKNIAIFIENAGKSLIRVEDDGCGIEKDDLPSAFLPHATSKIAKATDLDGISTLGFRGEALASIASVSKCEIVSATRAGAYSVSAEGGNTGPVEPSALDGGTRVSVCSLFYNTPVRARFLRTDKKEESDITSYVTRFILGNPETSFRYVVDGKEKLRSFGEGLDEAVAEVYGASTIGQCFKICANSHDIGVHGFIGSQNFFKPNKSYQSVFLNGRSVVNGTIQTAVSCAYQAYAMKRQYPFYVLFVDVPSDFVDVNVHPNKSDVRFVDDKAVFSAVYKIISSVLDGTTAAADFVAESERLPSVKSTFKDASVRPSYGGEMKPNGIVPAEEPVKARETPAYQSERHTPDFGDMAKTAPRPKAEVIRSDVMPAETDIAKERREQQSIILKSSTYVGSLFNTFLIYEQGDDVYLIDQHAAHERLLFDEYTEKVKGRRVTRQVMLLPYVFNTTPPETDFLTDRIETIQGMGFGMEVFGENSFRIYEVPSDLQDIDLKSFFDEFLSSVNSMKAIALEDVLRDKIAMTACKHAIKGGDILTQRETDRLFEMLGGDMGLKCPHGRPICVKITKYQLEKMFKRVV